MHCFLLEFVYEIHTYTRVHIRMRLSIDFFQILWVWKKRILPLAPSQWRSPSGLMSEAAQPAGEHVGRQAGTLCECLGPGGGVGIGWEGEGVTYMFRG